jgi:hypothetical protein
MRSDTRAHWSRQFDHYPWAGNEEGFRFDPAVAGAVCQETISSDLGSAIERRYSLSETISEPVSQI